MISDIASRTRSSTNKRSGFRYTFLICCSIRGSREHAAHRWGHSEWQWTMPSVDLNLLSQYGQTKRITLPFQRFSQSHSEMLSSPNEIIKQLVWNFLMKGLVLKVKLIYVMSAWSQSCSVIFWECDSDARQIGPPNSALTDMTVNKWRQQHPPLFVKALWALRAPRETAGIGAPLRVTAAWEKEDGTEQWQSSDHKTCPTKTQHSPWFTSLPSERGRERRWTFLFTILKFEQTFFFWFEILMISL